MSGKYLLDTNIVIALFAGEEAVIEMLKSADAVFSCAIVLGELFYCFMVRKGRAGSRKTWSKLLSSQSPV